MLSPWLPGWFGSLSGLHPGVPVDALCRQRLLPRGVDHDGETGAWHLSNTGAVPAGSFARLLPASPGSRLVVLESERGRLMPSLQDALERHHDSAAARGDRHAVAAE